MRWWLVRRKLVVESGMLADSWWVVVRTRTSVSADDGSFGVC
jgi:hypothetical protein